MEQIERDVPATRVVTRRRPWSIVLSGLVMLAVGLGAGWALATVLRPADDPSDGDPFTFATLGHGQVSSRITLSAVANWAQTPVGTNQASGIVTSVAIAPGEEVDQGAVLYTVGLRPVVAAAGDIPAFRDISVGTEGDDVVQLQEMLRATGYYRGPSDGKAGTTTVAAVKKWQKDLDVTVTGVVGIGDIIFVPQLPARVSLDSAIVKRSSAVGGGEVVLLALSPAPELTMPVTDDQAAAITTGTAVEVTSPEGGTWQAVAGDRAQDEDTTVIRLLGTDGGSVCADQCAQVPVTGEALLSSQVVVIPTVEGLLVPSAALVADTSGQVALVDDAGALRPVTVVESARGMSVIEGVDEGLRVRVPGEAGSTS